MNQEPYETFVKLFTVKIYMKIKIYIVYMDISE